MSHLSNISTQTFILTFVYISQSYSYSAFREKKQKVFDQICRFAADEIEKKSHQIDSVYSIKWMRINYAAWEKNVTKLDSILQVQKKSLLIQSHKTLIKSRTKV